MPATDTGDERPDGDCEPSDRSCACASSKPVALAFEDPTAGAAFCPSPPIGKRMARNADELVVDTVDSAGLLGRSSVGGRSGGGASMPVSTESGWGTGLRGSLEPGTARLLADPLMSASRRLRSSKGAPEAGP